MDNKFFPYILLVMVLSIGTINTNGSAKDRLLYLNKVMQNHDFVMVQEHWLHSDQLGILQSSLNNVCTHGVSGMPNTSLLHGRPYGGCAILWRKDIKCSVVPVKMQTLRACGVIISMDTFKALLISVYMPTDSGNTYIDVYKDTLSCISATIDECNVDKIIIGGDFNADLSRAHSKNTQILQQFVSKETLKFGSSFSFATCDYTFESKATGCHSNVDHFLISENLQQSLSKYFVTHEGDNLSDHSLLSLQLNTESDVKYIESKGISHSTKPLWTKASSEQIELYKLALDNNLTDIDIPWDALQCYNIKCASSTHLQKISQFHNDIVAACLKASDKYIPNSIASLGSKPGWQEYVQPYKETAIFWHNLWKDNGCPREGNIANIRRQTRARYHLAIKQLKKREDKIRSEKMADGILNNNSRNFWTEVKKVRKVNNIVPTQIEGKSDPADIANAFANQYKTVYNSVSYRKEDMATLLAKIEESIHSSCVTGNCSFAHKISINDVKNNLKHLNCGKHDGYLGHYTDHLINGTERLNDMLSLLFTSMMVHSFTPEEMLVCTIAPIPKDPRKSLNNISNYRGIALSSAIGKLLDWILIKSNPEVFTSMDLQFAYKAKASTTQCTFVANETIHYYLNNGSNVHAVLLDATKAFDRVHFVKLFNELLQKGLCPLLCKFLAYQYSMQQCRVKWCTDISERFSVTNGVKQGGVLSPILFTIYMDVLLHRLKTSNVGCHVGHVFAGSFAYADDILLLAPTRSSMEKLIKICESFSESYSISFNATKSRHIFFSKTNEKSQVCFKMQDSAIPTVLCEKHLGNLIGHNIFSKVIDDSVNNLYKNTNLLMSQFSKTNIDIKYRLFKSYCMSVYGSQLWDFSNKYCDRFYVAWRKCIRRLLGIPYNSHTRLLHLICSDIPVELQLQVRFVNFVKSCANSQSDCVHICSKLALSGSRSAMSKSWYHVCKKWNIDRYSTNVNTKLVKCMCNTNETVEDQSLAAVIHDLVGLREGDNDPDLNELIVDLCTS